MMDERKKKILKTLIDTYLDTGEPVGSLVLSSKLGGIYSPATIRNVLGELERNGYLYHTSVSSGRIPTDKGLRYFVEILMDFKDISGIEEILKKNLGSLNREAVDTKELLKKVISFISDYTKQLAFSTIPLTSKLVVKKVDLVKVSDEAFIMVVTFEKGIVVSKLLKFDEEIGSKDLERLVLVLNSEFVGKSVEEMESVAIKKIREELLYARSLIRKLEIISDMILEMLDNFEGEVLFSGIPNTFSWIDFIGDMEKVRMLIKDIEENKKIVRIVRKFIRENKKVIIGSEIEDELFEDTAIVISHFKGKLIDGAIGLVTPKKTNYPLILPFVERVAFYLSTLI